MTPTRPSRRSGPAPRNVAPTGPSPARGGVTRGPSSSFGLPVALLVALLGAVVALVAPQTAAEVRAAAPDLTIVTNARYDVRPTDHLVHVTVDATVVNHKSDTKTRRYYFDAASLAVLPGTRAFAVTASGAHPSVSVTRSTADYRLVRVAFGRRVYSEQTFRFRLSFDLPDPGGAANREIRVGQSLVSFPVWAYATTATPGSTVTVAFPAGYDVRLESGSLRGPDATGGSLVFTSGPIADPLSFYAFLSAERGGAYVDRPATTNVDGRPVSLVIRPWSDDAAWGSKVTDVVTRGLPALAEAIGLPYPRTDTLVIQEAVSRTSGGYAGLFDPASGRIEVAYYGSPFVVLHEISHAWFNGGLLADRWANEGFASYYAAVAARALGVPVTPAAMPADGAGKVALNAWAGVGREPGATETYGYAASYVLATAIAQRAGPAGLQAVWNAALHGEGADQPAHAASGASPERADSPPDWRTLLDLLETRTGQRFDDLWRTWVVRPDETTLLDRRASVRAAYAQVVAEAADWELPAAVRRAIDAWQFDAADGLLGQAREVLAQRDALEAEARAAGLALPDAVRTAFEGSDGFRVAASEAETERAAIRAIDAAAATRPAAPDPVVQLGLLGMAPDLSLAEARAAFSADRLEDAVASAESARQDWQAAADVGRDRLVRAALIAIIVLLALLFAVRAGRGRRAARRRASSPPAAT